MRTRTLLAGLLPAGWLAFVCVPIASAQPCPGGTWGPAPSFGRAPTMPYFQSQAPVPVMQPVRQVNQGADAPRSPGRRVSRNDIYLPAMPEMLKPATPQQQSPPRYAQTSSPKATPASSQPQPTTVVRGQAPEETSPVSLPPVRVATPTKLTMPSPEEMGLVKATARPTATPVVPQGAHVLPDWSTARSRLDQLGASYYRLERTQEGSFRFCCALPHAQDAARQRQFETQAGTEQEAIALALQQVEDWKLAQK